MMKIVYRTTESFKILDIELNAKLKMYMEEKEKFWVYKIQS